MATIKNNRNIISHQELNIDYILYLMIIPPLLPITMLYVAGYDWFFYGGFYLASCIIMAILFAIKYKIFILNYDKVYFSRRALYIFFCVWAISFSYSLLSKYLINSINGCDASIFASMIYSNNLGKFSYSTAINAYHMGVHQNYILFLLSIIYLIFAKSLIAVIFANSLSIIIASIFLYKISRLYFDQLFAIIIIYTFLSSPILSAYSGFYPEIYYTMALSMLTYCILSRQKSLYIIIASLFLLSIKEDSVLYMLGFLYLLLRHKRYRLMLFIAFISIVILIINLKLVAPYYTNKNILLEFNYNVLNTRFKHFGTTYHDIIVNILSHPIDFLAYCFDDNSGFWPNYTYWLFIPLLSPSILLSSIPPILLYTIGDNTQDLHKMINYHSFGIGTLAFIGVVLVLYYLISRYPRLKRLITVIGIYLVLFHNLFYVNFSLLNDMLDQSANIKDKVFALSRTPIDFLWWRAFYKINYQDVADGYKALSYLKNNYSHDPICVKGNIYNNFLDARLINIQRVYDGVGNGIINEPIANKKCILVFSNDSQFLGQDEINQLQGLMMQNKCVNYGKFHVCNNLN
jgi:hypothetical protein